MFAQLSDEYHTVIGFALPFSFPKQAITLGNMLGGVNTSNEVVHLGGYLVGSLLAGILGETIGPRPTLVIAGVFAVLVVVVVAVSPIVRTKVLSDASKEG